MGKYKFQPNFYNCGAMTIFHLGVVLKRNITIKDAEALCLTKSYITALKRIKIKKFIRQPIKTIKNYHASIGTDLIGIKRGVRKLGLKYKEFVYYDKQKFINHIDKSLSKGPVILLVNYSQEEGDLGHWVLCSKKKDEYYIIIDSAPYSGSVKQKYSESKLLNRMVWYDENGDKYYEMIGVAIKKK